MPPVAYALIVCGVLLAGCSTNPPQSRPSLPPLPMLEPRPPPEWDGRTYRDLLIYTMRLRESAAASESDKAATRSVLEGAP